MEGFSKCMWVESCVHLKLFIKLWIWRIFRPLERDKSFFSTQFAWTINRFAWTISRTLTKRLIIASFVKEPSTSPSNFKALIFYLERRFFDKTLKTPFKWGRIGFNIQNIAQLTDWIFFRPVFIMPPSAHFQIPKKPHKNFPQISIFTWL